MQRPCPICKKALPHPAPNRPFCSARCKDIDLANWLGESYRVSRPIMPWELEVADDDPDDEDTPYLH